MARGLMVLIGVTCIVVMIAAVAFLSMNRYDYGQAGSAPMRTDRFSGTTEIAVTAWDGKMHWKQIDNAAPDAGIDPTTMKILNGDTSAGVNPATMKILRDSIQHERENRAH